MAFLKNYSKIVSCLEKKATLDNIKKLFDVFIKEVIFDGTKFLIILKTTDMLDYSGETDEKEKFRAECDEFRTRFFMPERDVKTMAESLISAWDVAA